MIDIQRTLIKAFPDVEFSIVGQDYDTLVIHKGVKPTLEQIQAQWAIIEQRDIETEYQRKRKAEYPTVEEMVVAIWEAEMEQNVEPMEQLQVKRLAVKAKYPKPKRK